MNVLQLIFCNFVENFPNILINFLHLFWTRNFLYYRIVYADLDRNIFSVLFLRGTWMGDRLGTPRVVGTSFYFIIALAAFLTTIFSPKKTIFSFHLTFFNKFNWFNCNRTNETFSASCFYQRWILTLMFAQFLQKFGYFDRNERDRNTAQSSKIKCITGSWHRHKFSFRTSHPEQTNTNEMLPETLRKLVANNMQELSENKPFIPFNTWINLARKVNFLLWKVSKLEFRISA